MLGRKVYRTRYNLCWEERFIGQDTICEGKRGYVGRRSDLVRLVEDINEIRVCAWEVLRYLKVGRIV